MTQTAGSLKFKTPQESIFSFQMWQPAVSFVSDIKTFLRFSPMFCIKKLVELFSNVTSSSEICFRHKNFSWGLELFRETNRWIFCWMDERKEQLEKLFYLFYQRLPKDNSYQFLLRQEIYFDKTEENKLTKKWVKQKEIHG